MNLFSTGRISSSWVSVSPWYSPAIPPAGLDIRRPVRHPRDSDFGDHEYGMRFDRAVGALTYGFVYAYLWDRNPTDRVLGTSLVGGQRVLELQGEHERLHHFGATADYATTLPQLPLFGALPAVFRVEALYTKDVRYVDYAKQAAAFRGQSAPLLPEYPGLDGGRYGHQGNQNDQVTWRDKRWEVFEA